MEAQDAVQELESKGSTDWWAVLEAVQEHWLGSFLLNVLGYALIILPAALLIRKLKDSPSIKHGGCTEGLACETSGCILRQELEDVYINLSMIVLGHRTPPF